MLSDCNSQWRQCNANSAVNGPSKTSLELHNKKRIHKAWKSKIHSFIHGPSWRKINRQETNHTGVQDSLETLLSHKCGQIVFREFLKSEFCEENLDFWLACQDFKRFEEPEELRQRATNIYEEFIRADAPKQLGEPDDRTLSATRNKQDDLVNLDFNTSHIISQSLQRPSAACFVVAQRKIFSLMENGSFPRFLQSEQYQSLFHAGSGGRGKHRKTFRTKSAEGRIERDPKTIILS